MLLDTLLAANRESPDTLAVDDGRLELTYRRLTLLARVMARLVRRETAVDRVGIMLPASAVFPASLFGVLWAGKIAVPLNFLLNPETVAGVVRDSGIDLILTIRHFEEFAGGLPARLLFVDELPLKRRVLMEMARSAPPVPDGGPHDTAVLLYTSGTTAEPKGVQLTHQNLQSNGADTIHSLKIPPSQRFLNFLPPFHVYGLTGNVIIPIMLKSTVYAMPRFSPISVVKKIAEKRISMMLAIPSMYAAILKTKSARREQFESIDLAVSGGEPLSAKLRAGFEERFGVRLYEGYGLSETSPIIAASATEADRPGTVGKPIRNVEVKLVDDDGREIGQGADGEILVRGPGVMKGYYNKPEETAAVLDADGWFKTGDIGRFDADGYLSITGRAKEMLIIGGENVYPREIEAAIEQHEDVVQAAVIGVPDESRGEIPVAFVLKRDGAEVDGSEIRRFVKRLLAGFKVPKKVIIRDELPTGPTGKILKRKLHELL